MKLNHFVLSFYFFCFLVAGSSFAAEQNVSRSVLDKTDVSFRNEVQHAIDKGLSWLETNQSARGFWSTADHPAVTALALTAFMGATDERFKTNATVKKGYAFLLGNVQADGGIYRKELQNYNTSLSILALVAAKNPKYETTIRNARRWLAGQQIDLGEKGKIDDPFDGGVGYGTHGPRSDMNNTYTALEALYYSKSLDQDKSLGDAKDLNWKAVLNFLQSCQNLPGYNKAAWATGDPKNKGGFVYDPTESKAGSETNANGKVALRSYGSISYAGLLSYIYADLKRDDPRVLAVMDWLSKNFSLEENPGMGEQGYYYYLNLMTKGLSAADVDQLQLANGKKIDWRKEVAMKLINLQTANGAWANQNGRWWEKDPALVTSYSVIALEIISRGL